MVALIHDDMAVVANEVIHPSFSDDALNHRDVEESVRSMFSPSDSTDVLGFDTKENRQLRNPLVKQRTTVNEDQRARAALREEIRSNDRLSDSRRRNEDTDINERFRVRKPWTVRHNPVWIDLCSWLKFNA